MIHIGKYNTLSVLRDTDFGLFLGDDEGNDVLLPNKYCPDEFSIGEEIEVYVYLDFDERLVATNIDPLILLHEFANLQVVDITPVGAFLDMGLEKHLLVPFAEQRQRMEEGHHYVVYLQLDEKTNRLYGTSKVNKYLQNEVLSVAEGEQVEILIQRKTDLGLNVIINQVHTGLLFKNEIFQDLEIGDRCKAYVKKISEENKIDISLQPIGYEKFNDINTKKVFLALMANDGSLPLGDKSPPEEIYDRLGISKKAFKRAIGDLYKQRRISLDPNEIKLLDSAE